MIRDYHNAIPKNDSLKYLLNSQLFTRETWRQPCNRNLVLKIAFKLLDGVLLRSTRMKLLYCYMSFSLFLGLCVLNRIAPWTYLFFFVIVIEVHFYCYQVKVISARVTHFRSLQLFFIFLPKKKIWSQSY